MKLRWEKLTNLEKKVVIKLLLLGEQNRDEALHTWDLTERKSRAGRNGGFGDWVQWKHPSMGKSLICLTAWAMKELERIGEKANADAHKKSSK